MLELVNIHQTVPECWDLDIFDLVEVRPVDRRLDLGQVACHVLPNPWNLCDEPFDHAVSLVHDSVRRQLSAVWAGPKL